MAPDPARPERGRFVRDQVAALARLEGVEVTLHEFPPGAASLASEAAKVRRRLASPPGTGTQRWDVVHAHFGLTAWPALAVRARCRALTVHGTDVHHPRTRLATAAVLPLIDLLAAASPALAAELPTRRARRRCQVLPCGVDVERFHPMQRSQARSALGLEPEQPYLLFPADPARTGKRHDLALALSRSAGIPLLTLGGVPPEEVALHVNAANAVIITSDSEGFGLAALEALACDVPVLATPVGIHAEALAPVAGTLCERFDLRRWREALAPHLIDPDPRVAGRASAERFSAAHMAARVRDAWQLTLARSG
jgi:glycosyltransferase involved in cell wall biosynthesis